MKFLATMMEIVIGVANLKSLLFTLLYNMFRLPPINGHSNNKQAEEIHFHFMKGRKGGSNMLLLKSCCPRLSLGLSVLSHQLWAEISTNIYRDLLVCTT